MTNFIITYRFTATGRFNMERTTLNFGVQDDPTERERAGHSS